MMESLLAMTRDSRNGLSVGVPAFCCVNPEILRIVFRHYAAESDDDPLLIEASAEAVNRDGGYTMLTPVDLRDLVDMLASGEGISPDRIVLGGARLGPGPWADRPAAEAMNEAVELVRACVEAGYDKLHFDVSAACADEAAPDLEGRVARATMLCQVAELAAQGRPLLYSLDMTAEADASSGQADWNGGTVSAADLTHQLELYQRAFAAADIGSAMERVVGLVVSADRGLGSDPVEPAMLPDLRGIVADASPATLEIGAADYLDGDSLLTLAMAHVGIRQIGPELDVGFRRAVLAMSHIERWLDVRPSGLQHFFEDGVGLPPISELSLIDRLFGPADEFHRHWATPDVAAALQRLFANIDGGPVPRGLLEQYVPTMPRMAVGLPPSQRIIEAYIGPIVDRHRLAGRY